MLKSKATAFLLLITNYRLVWWGKIPQMFDKRAVLKDTVFGCHGCRGEAERGGGPSLSPQI